MTFVTYSLHLNNVKISAKFWVKNKTQNIVYFEEYWYNFMCLLEMLYLFIVTSVSNMLIEYIIEILVMNNCTNTDNIFYCNTLLSFPRSCIISCRDEIHNVRKPTY